MHTTSLAIALSLAGTAAAIGTQFEFHTDKGGRGDDVGQVEPDNKVFRDKCVKSENDHHDKMMSSYVVNKKFTTGEPEDEQDQPVYCVQEWHDDDNDECDGDADEEWTWHAADETKDYTNLYDKSRSVKVKQGPCGVMDVVTSAAVDVATKALDEHMGSHRSSNAHQNQLPTNGLNLTGLLG